MLTQQLSEIDYSLFCSSEIEETPKDLAESHFYAVFYIENNDISKKQWYLSSSFEETKNLHKALLFTTAELIDLNKFKNFFASSKTTFIRTYYLERVQLTALGYARYDIPGFPTPPSMEDKPTLN